MPLRDASSACDYWSLPVRGAWVEIVYGARVFGDEASRSPCGERGLKWQTIASRQMQDSVAPRAGSVG